MYDAQVLCNPAVIREILGRHGVRLAKALGQNFLKEPWVPERIVHGALVDKDTGVLEIGPGIGCLTAELSDKAGRVAAVELDERLKPVLAETLDGRDNVKVVFANALKLDIGALVDAEFHGLRPVVCANLPYNITTPIITQLLESGLFESITVMVQTEVGRRIRAEAGSSDYGAFTVFVNYYAKPVPLFDVPPGCFVPEPKVSSSVLRLDVRTEPPCEIVSEKMFFRVVRAAFGQRRKTLLNALAAGFTSGELPKARLAAVIESAGFDPQIRGERLTIEDFAVLANRVCECLA